MQAPSRDASTGYLSGSGTPASFQPGGECQIDKSSVWKRGEDGQMHTFDFDVFVLKPSTVDFKVGMRIKLTDEQGTVEEFVVKGIDSLNRRYTEIWG